MALNNQIIGSISGNLVADSNGNITGANFANITSNLQTFISNNGTDVKSVSIQSSTDAGFTANYTLTLPITNGDAGQSLTTDGSGNLSWTTISASNISNGNSNVVVYENANVIISSAGNANVVTVTGTGITIAGTANTTGDINTTGNVNAATFQNGNSNVVITANANITLTAKSNSTMVISDTGANITGTGNFSGNLSAANLIGPLASGNSNISIAANANITLTAKSNSTMVISDTGANITGNLVVSGANVSLGPVGNVHITGGSSGQYLQTDGSGTLSWAGITGGSNIANGNSNVSVVGNAAINMSSNGKANIFTITSNASTTQATIGNYQSTGSTVLSDASVNGVTITSPSINGYFIDPPYNANGYPVVYAGGNSTQPYANGVISTTVSSYNMGNGDWTLEGWYYFFDAIDGTANAKPWSTTGNLSNVSSSVTSLRLWDSTGYRANQPGYVLGSNFYSCLNLPVTYDSWFHVAWVRSGLSFSMYINGNLTTVANSTGGDNRTTTTLSGSETFNFGSTSAPNVIFPGFTSGTYRTRLSNTALYTANFTPSTTYGNTSSTVFLLNVVDLPPYYEANVYTGNLFLSNTANFQGNIVMEGPSINLGFSSNLHILGGYNGYLLSTDGNGFLSWVSNPTGLANGTSNISIPDASGNINMSVGGNADVLVVTGTGANITGTANVTGNFSTTGANVTLGPVGNVHITGGSSGQYLQTDGSGTLSWVSPSAGAAITNGTSNVNIPSSGGNVNTSVAGNANILVVTGTGANITGYANITGAANIGGTANVTGNANVGNLGTATAIITTGNITTVNTGLVQNGNSNVAITSNANVTITAKSNATMVISDTGANVTGTANVTGDILAGANVNVIANINGARFQNGNSNVTITSNANVTITAKSNATMVISDTGANITGTGNISGNLSAGNISTTALTATGNVDTSASANVTLGPVGNVHITGGSSGQSLTTDGSGTLSWTTPSLLANGTSNVSIPASGGNVNISSAGNANVLAVTGSTVVLSNAVGLTFTGNNGTNLRTVTLKATTNANFTANYSLSLPANLGSSGQALLTDGAGNLSWGGAAATSLANGSSNVVVAFNGNVTISSGGVSPIVNVTPDGANFNGDVHFANSIYVTTSGGIVGNLTNGFNSNLAIDRNQNGNYTLVANSNTMMTITSTAVNINGTGNISGSNINASVRLNLTGTGSASTGSGQLYLNGTGNSRIDFNTEGAAVPSTTTRSAGTKITLYPAVSATDVDYAFGISAGALWTSVPTASEVFKWYASTTEVANLTGSGALTAISHKTSVGGNFIAVANNGSATRQVTIQASTDAGFTGNYTLTLPVNDGDSGQVLTTNGSGVLSWGSAGGSSSNISNGTSNVNIPSSGGNVNISSAGNANILVVTGTGANIAGTLNATGNANVGNLGTTTAIITTGNITTVNTGLVQNGNSNVAITANANVTITAKSNATMVISDTGANITGTGNFSGNTSVLNLAITASNGDEGGEMLLAKPQSNTTIAGTGVTVDIYQNKLRFFEQGGSARGYYLDITSGGASASTNIIGGAVSVANIANGSSNVDIASSGGNVTVSVGGTSNVVVVSSTSANITGIANISGNIIGNGQLLIGTGTSSLTNPVAVFQGSGATYTQLGLFNSQGTGSADLVAYGNNGDDTQSWTDIGFTGNTFSDANYTITAAGDGYLFVQGNSSFGGNLVIATGNTGTTKDIIFATGGFQTANAKARLYNANGLFSVTANISSGNANLGNLVTANYFSGQANLLTVDGGNAVGFRNVPINSQSAAYTTVLSDSGKAIFHPTGDAARTYTIDSNANVAYPLGTVLTFINMSANAATIAINTDTLYLSGNGATGSRTLAQYGMASAIKMTDGSSNTWIISGSGLT